MTSPKKVESTSNDTASLQWEELQRARNRLNSKRTRERERSQIDHLESEKARLWVSNDAIKFQNAQYREAIARVREVNASKTNKSDETRGAARTSRSGSQQDAVSANRSMLSSANPSETTASRQGLETAAARVPPVGLGGSLHSLLPGGVAGSIPPTHPALTGLMIGGGHPSDPSSLSTLQHLRYQSALSSAHLAGFLPPAARDIDRHLLHNAAATGALLPGELELRLLQGRGGLLSPEELLVPRAETSLGGLLPDGSRIAALSMMSPAARAAMLAEHEQQHSGEEKDRGQKRLRKN